MLRTLPNCAIALATLLVPIRAPEDVALAREEHFVLTLPDSEGGRGREVGLAALRCRAVEGAEQTEWDLRFFGEETRVSHVERWAGETSSLLWREWRPREGRTLRATFTDLGLEVHEWGGSERIRETLEAERGALLPLAALELARAGTLPVGRVALFDPLSRAVEDLSVEVRFGPSPLADSSGEGVLERVVRSTRDDGTAAAEWSFRGRELWSVRWQEGGLCAHRIRAEEWEARLPRCGRPRSGESERR
jgi:hypothetical protein